MTDPDSQATPSDPPKSQIAPESYVSTPERRGPRRRTLLLGAAAVLLAIVVGVVGYLLFFQKSDPTTAKVGDCVSIRSSAIAATATRLSCDDASALYVVTAAGKSVTCDSHEVSYTGGARDRTKLCLFYNVKVGDCLTLTQKGDGDAKGTCAKGMSKVASVRTDTASAAQCPPEADTALTNTTRNRLICFAAVS
jgi:hypothetical protein